MENDLNWRLNRLRAQAAVLRDVDKIYNGCTISNAIQQIESIIKYLEKERGKS